MTIAAIEGWLPECTANYQDGRPAIGLGLTITLFFANGHDKEVRQQLIACIERYYIEFRRSLKRHDWQERDCKLSDASFDKALQRVSGYSENGAICWSLTSAEDDRSAPEYSVIGIAENLLYNEHMLSVIKMTFPWHYLKQANGFARFEEWLLFLCNQLPIEHGYAGLSSLLPHDKHLMFPYEYQLAKRFSGLMADSTGYLDGWNAIKGIKGVSWYTVLGNKYIERLGGKDAIRQQLADEPQIALLPYVHGLIIKAGDCPEMGEINTEGLPPLLVKVNRVIKPIRIKETGSLHFHSDKKDFQFDKESTAKWYARFDDPEPESLLPQMDKAENYVRNSSGHIVLPTDTVCPYSGVWSTFAEGKMVFEYLVKGVPLPGWPNKEGILKPHQWTLLNPDETIANYPIAAAVPDDIKRPKQ